MRWSKPASSCAIRNRARSGASTVAHEEIIYGVHAVDEALKAGEPVRALVIGRQRQSDPKLKPLIEAARERRIPVSFDQGPAFSALHGRNHQHVLASLEPFAYT